MFEENFLFSSLHASHRVVLVANIFSAIPQSHIRRMHAGCIHCRGFRTPLAFLARGRDKRIQLSPDLKKKQQIGEREGTR